MELKRQALRKKIWKEYDPFSGFPINTAKTDSQGWQSDHGYLGDTIRSFRPNVVVEVGV